MSDVSRVVNVIVVGASMAVAGACAKPASIKIDPATVTLEQRDATAKVTATALDKAGNPVADVKITLITTDPAVATVAEDGSIKAVGSGKCTVIGSAGEATGSAQVIVRIIGALALVPAEVSVAVGGTAQLTATVTTEKGAPVAGVTPHFTVDNTAVAVVGPNGDVRAVAPGEATVTVTAVGRTASAKVVVTLTAAGEAIPVPAAK